MYLLETSCGDGGKTENLISQDLQTNKQDLSLLSSASHGDKVTVCTSVKRTCHKYFTSIHKENSKYILQLCNPEAAIWTVWTTFVVQQQPARRLSNEAQEQNTQLLIFVVQYSSPRTQKRNTKGLLSCAYEQQNVHTVFVFTCRDFLKKLRGFSFLQLQSKRFILWNNSWFFLQCYTKQKTEKKEKKTKHHQLHKWEH